MKRKRPRTPAVYYVIAVILICVLAFAGYQALRIYLPQSKESGDFAAFKQEAGIGDISAQDIIEASAAGSEQPSDGSPVYSDDSSNTADLEPLRRVGVAALLLRDP